jgi:hypothetical protein
MKKNFFYPIISLLLIIWACSPAATVYSDQLQGVDFNQFKTYAVLPVIDSASNSLFHNAILEQNLIMSIDREMKTRGYILDNENPDILVNLHLKLQDRQQTVVTRYPLTSTYNYYTPLTDPDAIDPRTVHPQLGTQYTGPYYYPHYQRISTVYGTEMRELQYTEGTVVIDLIRTADSYLIWRGWSQETIDPNAATSDLQFVVEQIFREYPVKEKK